jgi:hypothetical protein
MAWETRGSNKDQRYYYRSVKVNGRVTRKYCGTGPSGEAAAREDEERREKCRQAREELVNVKQCEAEILQLMADLSHQCTLLARASLISAGFHSHRGNWRKRRHG